MHQNHAGNYSVEALYNGRGHIFTIRCISTTKNEAKN